MISNPILQSTIDGLKGISHVGLCVLDPEGNEVATTEGVTYSTPQTAREFAASAAEAQEIHGAQYFKVFDEEDLEFVLVAYGEGDDTYRIGKMVAFELQCLVVAYKEHFDQDNFIKNLLLDNLLLVDIYNRAKKLRISAEDKRVVMIAVYEGGRSSLVIDAVKDFIGTSTEDFVTEVDADNVILVKNVEEMADASKIAEYAGTFAAHLEKAGIHGVHIAYGTTVSEIKDVSRSYKEAKMALEVGKIFFAEKRVICYTELGIGRLIYQLPMPLCRMFIREIFGGKKPDDLDEEMLTTIDKFFENSLNVSETSRQLFIHRNTLVYRLDKLQKSTGLDLRVFEDAITFKIAMMVVKYMKHIEQ